MKGSVVFVVIGTLILAPHRAFGQQLSVLHRLETELWARIAARAQQLNGFTLAGSELDVRIPIHGEPEDIVGPTVNAMSALAVASAHIEPLDSVARDATFFNARYTIRLEDRRGNCLVVHQRVTFDGGAKKKARATETCRPMYMAEVIRRGRRVARLPLAAGALTDRWSIAGAIEGWTDVYMDSVVVFVTRLAMRSSDPIPDTASIRVDSAVVGLALGDENSWSIVRRSNAIPVDTVLRQGGQWTRDSLRVTIPIDSSFALAESWPVLELILRVAPTAENPQGIAWTYAHARKPFFSPEHPR